MKYRRKLLLGILLPTAALLWADIIFTYDASGNRTMRSDLGSSGGGDSQGDLIVGDSMVIDPIPTEGLMTLRIFNYDSDNPADLRMYNDNGSSIVNTTTTSDVTELDISGHKQGIYLLHVYYHNRRKTIKIIKR